MNKAKQKDEKGGSKMNSKEKRSIVGLVSICVLAVLFAAPLLLNTNSNVTNSTFAKTYSHQTNAGQMW